MFTSRLRQSIRGNNSDTIQTQDHQLQQSLRLLQWGVFASRKYVGWSSSFKRRSDSINIESEWSDTARKVKTRQKSCQNGHVATESDQKTQNLIRVWLQKKRHRKCDLSVGSFAQEIHATWSQNKSFDDDEHSSLRSCTTRRCKTMSGQEFSNIDTGSRLALVV